MFDQASRLTIPRQLVVLCSVDVITVAQIVVNYPAPQNRRNEHEQSPKNADVQKR